MNLFQEVQAHGEQRRQDRDERARAENKNLRLEIVSLDIEWGILAGKMATMYDRLYKKVVDAGLDISDL